MSSQLHATFLYHCAFAHSDKQSHVDVVLAPSTMGMQHVASLRVPDVFVLDDGEHPGQEQDTEDVDRHVSTDVFWRLEGYDLWIDPPEGAAAQNPPKVKVDLTFKERGSEKKWVVADFKRLSQMGIDRAFLQEEVPEVLKPGARVRIWGGALRGGPPEQGLRERLWILDNPDDKVGLCDRVEFEKDLVDRTTVKLRFRKFGDVRFKTVTLRSGVNGDGPIRLFITNDPTVEETHDPRNASCDNLPHFQSYALIVRGSDGSKGVLTPPTLVQDRSMNAALTIAEGGGLCCPCGGGQPEP